MPSFRRGDGGARAAMRIRIIENRYMVCIAVPTLHSIVACELQPSAIGLAIVRYCLCRTMFPQLLNATGPEAHGGDAFMGTKILIVLATLA